MSKTPLRERLGPLIEREYRLLFSATTITTLGDAVAGIALAFAVLDLTGSATDLGIVSAVRSAYDSLGSFVLTPLGTAIAGPIAAGIGTKNAFWLAVAAILCLNTGMLLIPSVWKISREQPATTMG